VRTSAKNKHVGINIATHKIIRLENTAKMVEPGSGSLFQTI